MAIWSFGLLLFKLEVIMYGSLGIVPSGTAANTTIVNLAHMQLLWDIVHEVDEIRGDVINTLSETHARLDNIVTLMTNQHDAFAAAHPLLINTFELVQQGWLVL